MKANVVTATEADLGEIVGLHLRSLPWTINSRAGPQNLARLYGALLADPACAVVVARYRGGVVGGAAGTVDYHAASRMASHVSRAAVLRVLARTRPTVTLPLLWDTWRTHREIERIAHPYNFLLTWFTDPAARGRGIGLRMLIELIDTLGERGRPLVVDVSDEAVEGHAAYEALGFRTVARAPHTSVLRLDDTSTLTERK